MESISQQAGPNAFEQLVIDTVRKYFYQPQPAQPNSSLSIKPNPTTKDFRLWDETYKCVWEGTVTYNGSVHPIKIGLGTRFAAGIDRVRGVVLSRGELVCEWIGSDSTPTCLIASQLKLAGQIVPDNNPVPPEYASLANLIGPYRSVVDGPNANYCLAVICKQNDFATMIEHAMIRIANPRPAKTGRNNGR